MLYLFNTTIMPNEGLYLNRKVSLEQALQICKGFDSFVSAIGHQGAADAFNQLGFFDGKVAVNRISAVMEPGDQAIAIKVLGRLPEGAILTLEELQQIGFELYHVTNFGASFSAEENSAYHSVFGWLTPVEHYTNVK